MNAKASARVHYFDRQFLRTQEFIDEQTYHLEAHRRHQIAHHIWGIVSGLVPGVDDDNIPSLSPGFAVDGYGRALVLPEAQPLSTVAFDDKGSDELTVWLVYDRFGSDSAPTGYAACGEERSAGGFYRWQEKPQLRLEVSDPDVLDPGAPESVPEGDIPFDPSRTPPDDVHDDWPVFLGTFKRDRSDPVNPVYSVNLSGRPYAGAIAASLAPPWDRDHPWVVLGGDEGQTGSAFSISVPKGEDKMPSPALAISHQGVLTAHGDTTVFGDLSIEAGAVEFLLPEPEEASTTEDSQSDSAQPEEPQPWRIYRHREMEPAAEDTVEPIGEQLRIEMGTRDDQLSAIVIGTFSEEAGQFVPCLTVNSNCSVIVHGNLVVRGQIDEELTIASRRVSPGLSPTASQSVLATFHTGIGTPNLPLFGQATIGNIEALARALAANPEQIDNFAARFRVFDGNAASRLAEALKRGGPASETGQDSE